MIEAKHIDEVDVADWPGCCSMRCGSERADIMQLENDIISAMAKKLCVNGAVNETAELIADYGPFHGGCLVNTYSNTLQFCGTFCESLEKLDEVYKQRANINETNLDKSLADSIENCKKHVLERLYPSERLLSPNLPSVVFLDVKKGSNYARYVPSILGCEPELFIKFDTADELAEWMRDKMNTATTQTKKLISELYKTAKKKQLELERQNAT